MKCSENWKPIALTVFRSDVLDPETFELPEVGETVVVLPAAAAAVVPGVVVVAVAAHRDHGVDGAGAADHLAAPPARALRRSLDLSYAN